MNLNRTLLFIFLSMISEVAFCQYLSLNKHFSDFYFHDKEEVESRRAEERFARFLIDVVRLPRSEQVEQVQSLLLRAEQAGCMERFMQLAEKYLYEPNSPYYNEGLYVVFLEQIPDFSDFARYKHHYELIAKNQVGSRASDFSFVQQNGLRGTLYGIESNYTVLFFNDPTCQECNQVKRQLENNYATFEQKGIRVVAVYIDSEVAVWKKAVYHTSWLSVYAEDVDRKQLYNVRALPTLYLLDKQKRVLLKDVSVEKLIKYLEMI